MVAGPPVQSGNSRLDASLGLALLHEKHDADRALSAFQAGLQNDADNVTVYLGADQALSLLARPASERVQVLEKFPDLANAPSSLIFELILNLAEAGDFQRAESLFHNRFFPREEGGTNVRQVWIEVELQKMLAAAKAGHCADALVAAEHLGSPAPDLSFTRDGLEPILQSARTNYQLGTVYSSCSKPEEAAKKFQRPRLHPRPIRFSGPGGRRRNCPGLMKGNGSRACSLRSSKQKVDATPAVTPVGGITAQAFSRAL